MRSSSVLVLPLLVSIGCGSGTDPGVGAAGTASGALEGGSNGTGGDERFDAGSTNLGGGSGSTGGTGNAGSTGSGGTTGGAGATGNGGQRDAGREATTTPPPPADAAVGQAGNPNGSCRAGIPAKGQPVDTSNPTAVVGSGTAASCTFAALRTAVTAGGTITFNCGSAPATILVTSTLTVPATKNVVIDGGSKITLDGGGSVQIMHYDGTDFQKNTNTLTLQHITLKNGRKVPTDAIASAPSPCSQGWDDGQGGALYMNDGNLVVIDSIFTNNQAAPLGPDTGGGAIYVLGSKNGVLIVGSTFTNNTAANGAGVGTLFAELDVYNSLFTGNTASGNGANYDDATMCSVINNGQNEVGSGGNGGALYNDGLSVNVTLCGDAILNNKAGANAFGGGLFFTSNDMNGTLTITDTTMSGNTGGSWTNATTGVMNVGSAVGVNAKSIAVANSTLQGVQ
ncbi:MAG TPA: hypothetical protein VGL13_10905 [Polyangiaceae bacterium]